MAKKNTIKDVKGKRGRGRRHDAVRGAAISAGSAIRHGVTGLGPHYAPGSGMGRHPGRNR